MSLATSDSRLRTYLPDRIGERTTPVLTLGIVDEDGQAIASLATLFLTIHKSGQTVRARGSVLSSFSAGTLAVRLAAEDTRILGTGRAETHTALIEWTWNAPNGIGWHEIVYQVENNVILPVVP